LVTIVFLKNSTMVGTFPSTILIAVGVGEDEVVGAALSTPESPLESSSAYWLMGRRSLMFPSAMECIVGRVQQAVE
jgi:hypothetical protein